MLDIILDNSVKYTKKVILNLMLIRLLLKNNIARLIITIEDSGTGMKASPMNGSI